MNAEDDHPSAKKTSVVTWVCLVAVVCIVAAIAIPNLLPHNCRSKSSESKSNLGAIRSFQVAYFVEWSSYIGGQSPTPVADRRHRPKKEKWNPNTRFSILGFAPEDDVYFSYGLAGSDNPTAAEGFTATAVGDLDDDGKISVYSVNNANHEVVHSGAPF